MKTTGYFDPVPQPRPRIFAHRGLSFRGERRIRDENTLGAFELALQAGADYLETDIRVTSDGVAVLFHDHDLHRLTGRRTSVTEIHSSELAAIKLPHGGQIPTLAQVLAEFPSAKFNLDLKSPATEHPAMEVIVQSSSQNRVLVSSFSERSRLRALALSKKPIATSAGSSKVLRCAMNACFGTAGGFAKLVSDVDALQVPTRAFGIDFTNPKFIQRILENNIELHYWVINEPKLMLDLFSLGAHGIVTDRADIAVRTFS